MLAIQQNDRVLVALHGNRVARLGTVLELSVADELWQPFVPVGPGAPYGEKGRRILVRWDLELGPDDRDMVVQLPAGQRFTSGELRPTIVRIRSRSLPQIASAMRDPANWVPLWANFNLESSLSGYIAAYPHRLEDGLLPYPNEKLRERLCRDGTRIDVLLVDQDERPVIVECKQYSPTVEDVRQLKGYMRHVKKELSKEPRGILVHGGAQKLRDDVRSLAAKPPLVQLVQHRVGVDFSASL